MTFAGIRLAFNGCRTSIIAMCLEGVSIFDNLLA